MKSKKNIYRCKLSSNGHKCIMMMDKGHLSRSSMHFQITFFISSAYCLITIFHDDLCWIAIHHLDDLRFCLQDTFRADLCWMTVNHLPLCYILTFVNNLIELSVLNVCQPLALMKHAFVPKCKLLYIKRT